MQQNVTNFARFKAKSGELLHGRSRRIDMLELYYRQYINQWSGDFQGRIHELRGRIGMTRRREEARVPPLRRRGALGTVNATQNEDETSPLLDPGRAVLKLQVSQNDRQHGLGDWDRARADGGVVPSLDDDLARLQRGVDGLLRPGNR